MPQNQNHLTQVLAKATVQEKIALWLTASGWVEQPRLTKYRVFSKANLCHKYFVGRKGALRRGKNISTSWSARSSWKSFDFHRAITKVLTAGEQTKA